MRRKCAILQESSKSKVPMVLVSGTGNHKGRDRVDRSAQFEAFKELMIANGVDITRTVPGQGYVIGWVQKEQIPVIRALDEVAVINDDYAYLVQESDLGLQPETSGQDPDGS